jgi:hypothetical protein
LTDNPGFGDLRALPPKLVGGGNSPQRQSSFFVKTGKRRGRALFCAATQIRRFFSAIYA